MKNLKNYAMALVALFIAATSVTLMSFSKPENIENLAVTWFSTDENGLIDTDNPQTSQPDECESGEKYCAVSFNNEDLTPQGHAPISDATDDPNNLIQVTLMRN